MALKLEDKQAIVAEVAAVAAKSTFALAASYRGLTVSQMTELRAKGRDLGVYVRVVRNTLARRAVKETIFECMQEALVGPMILMLSPEDPGSIARLVRDFAKENKLLEVKALSMNGQLLDASKLEAVASLPSREEALGMLLSVLQAPLTKLARTLAEPYAQLARVLAAVRDQKQAA